MSIPNYSYCLIFLVLLFSSAANCQKKANETSYFIDVTETHIPIDPKTHALDVVATDVNGDGLVDLVLALEKEPNRLYINVGNGKFTWKKDVFENAKNDTEHVRIADFDNDGFVDVIFVSEDDQNHEYYLGNGDGTFKNVSDRLPKKSEGNGLDVADVNGDGYMDVVVGNTGVGARNFVWLNDPKKLGYFIESNQSLPMNNDLTQSVKLADLNGDGFVDMALGNEGPPARLYFNDGKGNFGEKDGAFNSLEPMHTREVLAFDANEDGLLDLFFANLTSNGGKVDRNPKGRLFLNQGSGVYKDVTESHIPDYEFSTYAANVIDYDRDGDLDLILSALKIPPFEAMQVQALKNDGKGKFEFSTADVIPDITKDRSWGIAVADVNADGIADLIIGAWGGQVRLLLGK
ncbi:FG-GAP repeat domain-containing protein [Sphingobacterium sp. HJSM2_6]|uniref:FG-GAP repeat domain-containing protein n=1 Tax=Sphingobacterium sp. HJSM2_6 TaxID=3366264 RepID=UPI003BED2A8E